VLGLGVPRAFGCAGRFVSVVPEGEVEGFRGFTHGFVLDETAQLRAEVTTTDTTESDSVLREVDPAFRTPAPPAERQGCGPSPDDYCQNHRKPRHTMCSLGFQGE